MIFWYYLCIFRWRESWKLSRFFSFFFFDFLLVWFLHKIGIKMETTITRRVLILFYATTCQFLCLKKFSIPIVLYSMYSHYKFAFTKICGPHIDVDGSHHILKTLIWYTTSESSMKILVVKEFSQYMRDRENGATSCVRKEILIFFSCHLATLSSRQNSVKVLILVSIGTF